MTRSLGFRLSILGVVLPLLLLAVLAALGTRAQRRAAWDQARQEAERMVARAAREFAQELERRVRVTPDYPDPPVPGVASELDAVLDGGDLMALQQVRDDPAAGLSPAGLPRRVLAALRAAELSPEARDLKVLAPLLTEQQPSVLTRPALVRWQAPAEVLARWDELEQVRRELPVNDPRAAAGRWRAGPAWAERRDASVRMIPAASFAEALQSLNEDLPPWARLRPAIEDLPETMKPAGERWLATATVPFATGLRLEIMARAEAVEATAHRQQRWTYALLAVALAVSGSGLWLIQRTLARERKLNEMKSQFVASVSHELRAPVASIRLMADALQEGKIDEPAAKEFHRLISRESARLSALVGNVLDHSRIERGNKVWKRRPCEVAPLLADTLRLMEPLAAEKDVALRSQTMPVVAVVEADAIRQALVNLIDNAIKFSPAGGEIRVTLTKYEDRGNWELAVEDEGPGVPLVERGKIFERFYRPGDELRRETQGAGIGLSLVKAIVEAHEGRVDVGEGPAGRGARFALVFPWHPPSSPDPSTLPPP